MVYSLFVALLFCCNAFGNAVNRRVIRQSGSDSCTTPDGQPGTCIRLQNCRYLHELLKTQRAQNPEIMTFLRKSQCGRDIDKSPKVCCNLDPKNPPVIPPVTRLGSISPVVKDTNSQTAFPAKDYSICGKNNKERIVGGKNASLGDWPWMVAIGYRRDSNPTITWECGGSLISDRWVVTAAHCTEGIGSLILTTVRVGDLNLDNDVADEASPVDVIVDKIIPHPHYQIVSTANDIALLRLKDSVTFTSNIRPICIPKGSEEYKREGFYFNKSPYIAGWGHTRAFMQSKETRSDALLTAQVDIVDIQVCDQKYRSGGKSVPIDARVLCASSPGIDTCQGDSGGPLMMPIKGLYHLTGIVSFGVGCADEQFPGVYTRVAYFADWIRNTTQRVRL